MHPRMSAFIADAAPIKRLSSSAAVGQAVRRWLPFALVLAAAIVQRHFLVANTDVSWLLTAAEKVLDGQRLYIDIIEINPPASVFLYMPAVLIARFCGLAPEPIVDSSVLVSACASIWLSGRILARAHLLETIDGRPLAVFAAAILLIVPAQTFGEREHIAVIVLLPFLAALIGRAQGYTPEPLAVVAAGIGAGAMVIIKPQLALGVVAAIGVTAFHGRSLRIFVTPENLIAAILIAAYGAVVVVLFPQFISDFVPLAMAVYVPIKNPLSRMLPPIWMSGLMIFLLVIVIRMRDIRIAPYVVILIAASTGFGLAYFVQGKGWPYHSYPMLALALLALTVAFLEQAPMPAAGVRQAMNRAVAPAVLIAVACPIWLWMNLADDKSYLAEPIRHLKAHPTMLAIATDISLGHPLVRQVEGSWVGTVWGLWITFGTTYLLRDLPPDSALAARLADYATRDRKMLANDIRQHRPDIILVERSPTNWSAWAQSDPSIAEELRAYTPATVTQHTIILQRHDEARAIGSSAAPSLR